MIPTQADDVTDEPPARAPLRAPAPAPVVVPAPEGDSIGSRRSEETALLLSLGGTAVSWGLVLGRSHLPEGAVYAGGIGAVLAPSLGHWYAGTALTRGMGARLLGTAAIVGGFVWIAPLFEQPQLYPFIANDIPPTAMALMIGGLALVAAGTIDDIITAPSRVRRENRKRGWDVGLAPVVTQHSTGFALGGRF